MPSTYTILAVASYVLVPSGATLHVRPDTSSPELTVAFGWNADSVRDSLKSNRVAATGPEKAPPPPTAVMEVVDTQGDFFAVHPIPWSDFGAHCTGMLKELADLNVTLYVHKKELVTVLTRQVNAAFSDGTGLSLTAGVPVTPAAGAPGRYWADARGVPLLVEVEEAALGVVYETPQLFAPPKAADFQLKSDTPLRYGTELVTDGRALFTLTGRGAAFSSVEPKGTELVGLLRNPCLELKARVDPGGVLRAERTGNASVWRWADGRPLEPESDYINTPLAVDPGHPGPRTSWDVKPPSSFREGASAANESRVRIPGGATGRVNGQFVTDATREEVGSETCFRPSISAKPSDRMRFCFDSKSLDYSKKSLGLGSIGLVGHGSGSLGFGLGLGSIGTGSGTGGESRYGSGGQLESKPRNSDRYRFCYEKGLERDARLAGSVTLRLDIGARGEVVKARSKGSDLPKSVVECVVKAAAGAVFPASAANTTVIYPLSFSPD